MSSRDSLSLAGIWMGGCLLLTAGCSPELSSQTRQAFYPSGVTFIAKGTGAYDALQWQNDNANNPQPCPLVLHLPGGDLTAKELADPKLLHSRGWRESYRDDARGLVEFRWLESENGVEKSLAQVTLAGGNLDRVLVRTTEDLSASLDGKRVPLPITAEQLEQLLGQPLRVEVTDVFQGKVK